MTTIIRFLTERGLVVNLISIFLVGVGIVAILMINREAFPNVNLDKVQVNIRHPGSTPEEVERLVITPIEQELKSLDGVDKMSSVAFPGSGIIELELDPDASNRSRIVSDVQLAVDRADLPDDLPDEPIVIEVDGKVFPIIQIAASAPVTPLELKRLGDIMEDDLLAIPGVAKVQVQGERKAEIRVEVDPEKLRKHRITVGEIAELLASWNINAPGGDVKTAEGQKIVRIVGEFKDAADASGLVIRANERGEGIRLGDVANVTESLEKARVYYDVAGEPAVSMVILKQADADIISVVDRINRYLVTVPERYGENIRIDTFRDFSKNTRLRLQVLSNNALVGLILVFITLILFLRFSVAMTTTWGLPIVFLSGLFILYSAGITLNLISMMGFIIVLGMLVDDAIIIGENITYHMEQGMQPNAAAVKGAMELLGPVTTTIMTTVVAFIPMLFMSGIIGKFIVAIPIVVITLLILSWLESFLILPSHVAHVTNPNKHPPERAWLLALENIYARLLAVVIRHHWITVGIALALLLGSMVLAKTQMSFQLFPSKGVEQFMVRVMAPPGTSLDSMREQLIGIEKVLRQGIRPEYLETTILTAGETAKQSGDPLTQRGSRFGQIRVIYIPAVLRPEHTAVKDMQALSASLPRQYPELVFNFEEIKVGPPTGRALEVEISSNDNTANESVARKLMDYLHTIPGVTSVESGLQPGDDELHVIVDRTRASYARVDLATIARHVRAAVDGLRVSTTRRGTEEIDITIHYPSQGQDKLQMLQDLRIQNRRGGLVYLSKIASFEKNAGFTTIRHKAGLRVVRVMATIDPEKLTSLELNRMVAANQQHWLDAEAASVEINYGGENEKNQESFRDLLIAMVIALIGIFFILAIQFNNLGYPFVVMLAIPFGIFGIIISFYLHDRFWQPTPLSFFSTMGMVALTGVVVNSSLVLLVFIQRAIKSGMEKHEAVLLAGRRRLRAVLLTAITTVVGLLPTAYGWGGLDPFVSSLALALSWGLIFATLITLIVIPAVLVLAMDTKQWLLKPFRRRGV